MAALGLQLGQVLDVGTTASWDRDLLPCPSDHLPAGAEGWG